MTYTRTYLTKILSAVVITCAVAAFYTVPAAAQNATSLTCNGCLKSKQIKNGKVKGKDLKDQTVTGSKIAPDAIDSSKIADGTVGTADLGGSAVNGAKVQDHSVTADDIENEAAVDFTNDSGAAIDLNLSSTWAVMRSRAITHHSSGYVTCIAMGNIDYDSASSSSAYLGWDDAGGTAQPESYNQARLYAPAAGDDRRIPISAMHTFPVTGVGTTTFYLKSRTASLVAASHDFAFHGLACMFFPTRA